jgi:eukaryotic-like serine/threonine-protein kinase
MATVHLGRLLGPVGFARTVAIKRLHENFARDPQFVAMFVDEARLAARIQHPNVVDMLDVITTEGELFLVLAYIHGESLATLLRIARSLECRVPVGVLAGVIIGVLHGLHAAHEARSERGEPLGIVHRDVSPHNILVGGDGIPRLLDFGVAKAAGRMQESRSGEIKGKLAYMAPEQVRGDADRRTDVYSTSVILWEGLTGRRLFRGDNDAMLVYEVLEGKVEPPSRHAAGIPAELDALVLRGLATDPATRFATAREMARALEQVTAVASASAIGEWVETLARDSLADRARHVEAAEESSASLGVPRASNPSFPAHGPAAREPADAAPGEVTRSLPSTAPSTATDRSAPRDPETMPTRLWSAHSYEPRRSPSRHARSLVLYGALVVAGIGAWGAKRWFASSTASTPVAAQPGDIPAERLAAPAVTQPPTPPETVASPALLDATAPTATSSISRRPSPRPTRLLAPAHADRDLERAIDSRK